jgi:UDP-N-acetylmuramoylalanine--D-glutamate ligase
MLISQLINKNIALLGLGREGLATYQTLRANGHEREILVLADTRPNELPPGARFVDLAAAAHELDAVDVVIRSPGFPPGGAQRTLLDRKGCQQITATQIFLCEAHARGLTTIGITGSKGKSTTSSITHALLRAAGHNALLVGNIGLPALSMLEQATRERALVVMELSSYQCMDLQTGSGPDVAYIGPLFPEHIDYHGSYENYIDAKLNLARSQRAGGLTYCHASSRDLVAAQLRSGSLEVVNTPDTLHFADGWFMDGTQRLCSDAQMRLLGHHNRENASAAFGLARRFGATATHLEAVLSEFRGLPFRLELEGQHGGITWINDSISTAPQATAAAIEALAGKADTLIAGGFDRGYEPAAMVDAIAQFSVRNVILLPDTGLPIAQELARRQINASVHSVETLSQAVDKAFELTPPGGTCLFSPGAPSYNQFANFEARGLELRRCINAR